MTNLFLRVILKTCYPGIGQLTAEISPNNRSLFCCAFEKGRLLAELSSFSVFKSWYDLF